jgi:hypothetical protein
MRLSPEGGAIESMLVKTIPPLTRFKRAMHISCFAEARELKDGQELVFGTDSIGKVQVSLNLYQASLQHVV